MRLLLLFILLVVTTLSLVVVGASLHQGDWGSVLHSAINVGLGLILFHVVCSGD